MMSLHKISAGDGYAYYTNEVSRNDEVRKHGEVLTDYYLETGNPPGEWIGQGAANLDLDGEVTEEQMQHLFGEGVHPDADNIVRREIRSGASKEDALKAVKLGRAYYSFKNDKAESGKDLAAQIRSSITAAETNLGRKMTPDERSELKTREGIKAFRESKNRGPGSPEELSKFVDAELRGPAQSVAGFDLTFSPQKSVSVLWALSDTSVAKEIESAHKAAISSALEWVEREGIRTRTGKNGIGQIDVQGGVAAARFRHHDSREGDPQLHDHVVVSNKVLGTDGEWRSIDGGLLYKATVASSEHYNSALMRELNRRLGVTFSPREMGEGKRPVMEVDGVDNRLIGIFSSRRQHIDARLDTLTSQYREQHGKEPSKTVLKRLAQQATLDTRPKKKEGVSLGQRRDDWHQRAVDSVGPEVLEDLSTLTSADVTAEIFAPEEHEIEQIAADVVAAVSEQRATWTRRHVEAETIRQLGTISGGRPLPDDLSKTVVEVALEDNSVAVHAPQDHKPTTPELTRADGVSIYTSHASKVYTSATVLDAEAQLLDLGGQLALPPVSAESFDRTISRLRQDPKFKLSPEQETLARDFACGETVLRVGIGPAGAGKTKSMATLAEAVRDAGGDLIGLAPSRQAASVLGQDLGVKTDTIHSWILQDSPLQRGSVILVDEAGMAGTPLLDKVVEKANRYGASIRLIGDYHQLAAVESGGALRMLHKSLGGVELSQLFRFSSDDEAKASLTLRDGDPARENVFEWYHENNRLVAGQAEHMSAEAFTAWSNDVDAGRDAIMLGSSRASVDDLNRQAQAVHIGAGDVNFNRSVQLRDTIEATGPSTGRADPNNDVSTAVSPGRAGEGDIIVARQNDRRLTVSGTSSSPFVVNGSRWRIHTIDDDGNAIVAGLDGRSETVLPAAYLREHAQLGYAMTVHQAQGVTVDACHAVLDTNSRREAAYVALTRGREANHAYIVADDGQSVYQAAKGISLNTDSAPAAYDQIRSVLEEQSDPKSVATIYHDVVARTLAPRIDPHLEAAGLDPEELKTSTAYSVLVSRLAHAEAAGHDVGQLVDEIAPNLYDPERPPRDPAAVLVWRADQVTGTKTTEAPTHGADGLPEWLADSHSASDENVPAEIRQDLHALRRKLVDQTESLRDEIAADPPQWALDFKPAGDGDRDTWLDTAAEVAAWRAVNNYAGTPALPETLPKQAQASERVLADQVAQLKAQTPPPQAGEGHSRPVHQPGHDAIRQKAEELRGGEGQDSSRDRIAQAKQRAEEKERRRLEEVRRRTAPRPDREVRGPRRTY
ncbi:MAG: MobF family relaxase [Brevibacterium aurantiacum]|uniref:MobF family relaxase n=1 Tax=Brevibacterium aurantiacum TaxID=273384 RepID=UPI003F9202E9